MTNLSLKEHGVAIVTGASRGIGAGIALELASRGVNVLITYTSASSKSKVDGLIQSISSLNNGTRAHAIAADLRDPESPRKIVAESQSAFPSLPISILVNNAGCELAKPVAELTLQDLSYVHDLNVRAPMLMVQAVLPHMPKSGGRIINIGSVGARKGFPGLSLYCSSKAALEAFTRCWAFELGSKGITVNCVNPGPVESDMIGNIAPSIVDMQKKHTPAGNRLGVPDDIAQIVGWLAEEKSRWVTGQCLSASGGLEMY